MDNIADVDVDDCSLLITVSWTFTKIRGVSVKLEAENPCNSSLHAHKLRGNLDPGRAFSSDLPFTSSEVVDVNNIPDVITLNRLAQFKLNLLLIPYLFQGPLLQC